MAKEGTPTYWVDRALEAEAKVRALQEQADKEARDAYLDGYQDGYNAGADDYE